MKSTLLRSCACVFRHTTMQAAAAPKTVCQSAARCASAARSRALRCWTAKPRFGGAAHQLLWRARCAALAPPSAQGDSMTLSRRRPGVAAADAHGYRSCCGVCTVAAAGAHVAHQATATSETHATGALLMQQRRRRRAARYSAAYARHRGGGARSHFGVRASRAALAQGGLLFTALSGGGALSGGMSI